MLGSLFPIGVEGLLGDGLDHVGDHKGRRERATFDGLLALECIGFVVG